MVPICNFTDVSEHDMDILFLEEFVVSKEFLNIFTSKVDIFDATVIEIEHSKTHPEFGESDMTVIVEIDQKRIGLLIEDKIDAIAMPEQYSRYIKRGEIGVINGDYSEFYVFVVAPEKYLKENNEAQKYPLKISYEECCKYFEKCNDNRSVFKLAQIKHAIYKQKTGYQVIENKAVTEFWDKYIAYQKNNYQHLFLVVNEGPKGAKALWPQFNTVIRKLYIIHKSEKGYIDLTIPGMAENIPQLENLLNEFVSLKENNMCIYPTGKSAAVRMIVPKLDFMGSFDEQFEDVKKCFELIEKLSEIVKLFDIKRLNKLLEK